MKISVQHGSKPGESLEEMKEESINSNTYQIQYAFD